jgi:hypothetical protein
MADKNDRTKEKAETPPKRGRKPYKKPNLVEYGSVAKLTQAGGSKASDAGGRKGQCL